MQFCQIQPVAHNGHGLETVSEMFLLHFVSIRSAKCWTSTLKNLFYKLTECAPKLSLMSKKSEIKMLTSSRPEMSTARNAWENQDNAGYLWFTSHCWCFALSRDNWKEDLWHLIVYCWTGLSETASTGQLISSGVVKVELMGLIAETGCEGAQLKCSMLFLIGRQTEIKTWFKVWARTCFPVSLLYFTFLVIRPALIYSVCVFFANFCRRLHNLWPRRCI